MKFFSRLVFFAILCLCLSSVFGTCATRPTLRLWSGYGSLQSAATARASVRVVQTKLNELDNAGLAVDGYFGRMTDGALRNWQSRKNLSVDGIVGPITWASLCDNTNNISNECNTDNTNLPTSLSGCRWTPRSLFVKAAIEGCFDWHYTSRGPCSDKPTSSHIGGNALDVYPGRMGYEARGADKAAGDTLAEWLVDNARDLKVKYVIWRARIWSLERAREGWRNCGSSQATCTAYNGYNLVDAHYDHVHVQVYDA